MDAFEEVVDHLIEFTNAYDLNSKSPLWWMSLCEEEWTEYNEAIEEDNVENILKEFCDIIYTTAGMYLSAHEDSYIKEMAYSMLYHYTEEHDYFNMEAFRRVHKSNMSKLGDDGKPIYREDGKVMKGPNYKPPYLGDLV